MCREVLLVLLIVLSGCSTQIPVGGETASVSCPPTSSIPDSPGEDPKAYPPLPDRVTRESVREFARRFERIRAWNEHHQPNTESFGVEIAGMEVSERDGGYTVYMSTVSLDAIHNGSSGRVAQSDAWAVEYFVAEEVVRRVEGNVDTDLDATDGAVVMYAENGNATICGSRAG
jgi:hypothetical protein